MLRFSISLGLVGLVAGGCLLSGFVTDGFAGGVSVSLDDGTGALSAIATRWECGSFHCYKDDDTQATVYYCRQNGSSPTCSSSVGPNCSNSCTVGGGGAAK